jgi:DNA-binding NtrC family response regulator
VLRRDGPLLLLGPRGCDQEWLARQIHDASSRREHPFVSFDAPLVRGAEGRLTNVRLGTAFVDLSRVGKVTSPFARALFAGETRLGCVRPVIAAVDAEQVRKALGDLPQLSVVRMSALADRRDDAAPLLNRLLVEHGSTHQIEELGARWCERLRQYAWPRNLSELRETERRLRALLESANKTEAARRLGSSRQALDKFLSRIFDGE